VVLLDLYTMMTRARAFELAVAELWHQGLISGEMHLGTGEEAVAAGVVAQMRPGDAAALDHRPGPVLVLLGVNPVAMLKEMLGREDGLCRGQGGHMHLFSPEHLAASSGIVGASGPLACGFGLSARLRRPGAVAVAFFGEGASNQGMLMESFNLAVAWSLPVVFVCKDNGWAITTRSAQVTGGDLVRRAEAFGLTVQRADGLDPLEVHRAAGRLFERAREGKGPGYLHVTTLRADGHFLNDPMIRMARSPIEEGRETFGKVISATLAAGGGSPVTRAASMWSMLALLRRARQAGRDSGDDPLVRARKQLKGRRDELDRIEEEVAQQIEAAVQEALGGLP
jgi:TPP-dependent pyruvate/acetoin dehydrogenase alpha subunit